MATIVLSAAGAAVGGSIGGTLAGLSSVAIGRAVGATFGRVIDQRLLGQGSAAVETGKVDRFRLTSSGEGRPVADVFGRMRVSGQVIWATQFEETVTVSGGGGGKGSRPTPVTTEYSYFVSLAIALCAGEITRVGRVWADGEEIAPDDLNMRVYTGSADQLPDPKMEAVEGAGRVPAYRGTAYVVIEDLPLARFGNRVPHFSFEVVRAEQPDAPDQVATPAFGLRGVAMIPGTGEYALATSPVYLSNGPGRSWAANISTPAQKPDFLVSLDALTEEAPKLQAASLVVSWFGDDLRCGSCSIRPKVIASSPESENMPWQVAGLTRGQSGHVPEVDGRPIYGGTPSDQSVIEAIREMQARGKAVMFYPFILMDQLAGNSLPDPYSDALTQPRLPWRGRITLSTAPGRAGSPDGTAVAEAEVSAFFGSARAADFSVSGGRVSYTGPQEWSLSRFILHYAALCVAAGGVEAFCIGSELRGLTQIRGPGNSFVAVAKLRELAAEVRSLLGPGTKISYAADWSEYSGYQPQDGTGDRYFHLDPLWADDNIDFIGIDNYMPLADWRDGTAHLDAQAWSSIYDPDYLAANIAGGEGFDWYYASEEARQAQIRTPITDGLAGEPWVFRYKDLQGWWRNDHHDRVGGSRVTNATPWVPMSKPIWFTEFGCAAVDKGANQPNRFLDGKSSEGGLPHFSTGARDELMQMQYLRAMLRYWNDRAHNPVSPVYGGQMVDMDRAFAWAWDARPYPAFPNNTRLWGDAENYARGHWLNGRLSGRSLASVVAEVCRKAGLAHLDVSQLFGFVRGYSVGQVDDARAALQPLMLRYGFDVVERGGVLHFLMRDGQADVTTDREEMARSPELEGLCEQQRDSEAELAGRVRIGFVQADGDFDAIAEEAVLPDEATHAVASTEFALAMTRAEGRQTAERWLAEARVARETLRFALPPSRGDLGPGDVVELAPEGGEGPALYRIDRVEQGDLQLLDAVRIEPEAYTPAPFVDETAPQRSFAAPVPVQPLFLDLPLLRGDEIPHAPHLAVTGDPWPGQVAVYQSLSDAGYGLTTLLSGPAMIGVTESALARGPVELRDRGAALKLRLLSGQLQSVTPEALLNGANLAAIGDGSAGNWEVFQFEKAELVGPDTYLLSRRLRGQCGTEQLMPDLWPEGSWVVMLNGQVGQIDQSPSLRRIVQHFRIGPASRGYDDPAYRHLVEAFDGNGLRPYAPCHLRTERGAQGDVTVRWIRRTRIGGDGWDAPEVPLGEETETYLVRVMQGAAVLREELVTTPGWTYTQAAQAADGVGTPFDVMVAQVSASYGAGLAARATVAV